MFLTTEDVVLRYKDPQDSSGHQVTLNVNANGGFDPTLMFAQGSGRLGFKYKMGGLSRLRRYVIRVDAYLDDMSPMANSTISFLTGENDGESQLYNLTGIILVLGISTIIMVVVMVCVGYEKLIQQKKEDCCDFLCCRREKRKGPKVSISPEPLMVQDRRDMDDDSPTSSHRY
ncbi:uncharacterized protein [Penaeus vannamei]|uniref:uncharacterized protein n=1 Tax=Penaeus vannamei TaxID=6689 RepID=UPI00387F46C0